MPLSCKRMIFRASYVAWGGGLASTFFLSIYHLIPWQSWIIVIVAFITTCIYIYFDGSKSKPSGWEKDFSQMIIPNALAVIILLAVILNPYLKFTMDELVRKHFSAPGLIYSGIETSMSGDIKDREGKMQFDNRKTDIAKRYNVDERFLVGCWFTLSAPADSRQTCYQKVIEIKIAQNEYGRIWDLSRPVYIWSSGIASEPEDLNEEFDGMVKYGYRLRVTCLSPGQILRILFVLKKNQASMSSHETWKYALSLRFSDN